MKLWSGHLLQTTVTTVGYGDIIAQSAVEEVRSCIHLVLWLKMIMRLGTSLGNSPGQASTQMTVLALRHGCLPKTERPLPCRAEPHADQDSSFLLQITAMIIMLCGVLFFGILIGSLGEIVSTASHKARRAQLFR